MSHPKSPTIPVWTAILLSINIVIGSGFFASAQKISIDAGLLAPLAWLLAGALLFPIVAILAKLSQRYPEAGGLYVYSYETLGHSWGFITGWVYFIGTVIGNVIVMHAFSGKLQEIPAIAGFLQNIQLQGVGVDMALVSFFALLNLRNIDFLKHVQILFTVLKCIPIVLALGALPFLFKLENLMQTSLNWHGLVIVLPLVLFSYIGIEACCAITDKINGGGAKTSRVLFISFMLIMGIYTLLQCSLLCMHGTAAVDPFTSILPLLTTNTQVIYWGNALIHGALLSSFLGGFYSMFYINNWNLYAIAEKKGILFSDTFLTTNKNQAPWVCILAQVALILTFQLMTTDITQLANMDGIGSVSAYLLSACAFLALYKKSTLGFLAIACCTVFIGICTHNLLQPDTQIVPFLIILFLGIGMHILGSWYNKYRKKTRMEQ